uniref:Uncharacterized protein n=1 Tax=Cliftonaea pectinata TaxID=2007206 RepID=A0A1Z1MQG9_9FLOR|nr:hypothetical protein [Cliftonaea pectinata]ARW68186.1 hypothetical protein [Cliftonaea pectinata]
MYIFILSLFRFIRNFILFICGNIMINKFLIYILY